MSNVFFISDLHLGHENIAIMRGFCNSTEQDNLIQRNWNRQVSAKDIVYVLGDVTMEKKSNIKLLKNLNGIKHLIGGNHDKKAHFKELCKYFESIMGCMEYKGYICTHIPILREEIGKWKGNIHGHTHGKFYDDSVYINVCAETVNYTPQPFELLIT